MTWVKTGDEFCDDAADLTDAAVRTHMDALHWSARRLLDLHIPKRDQRRFAFSPDADAGIEELVGRGWWVDEGTTWFVAYHADWQWSREQVTRRRESNAQAQERGRRHKRGDHSLCLPDRCPSAADTTADTADDTNADHAADPVGLGWVGDGTTKSSPMEQQEAQ